ncbi:hypothetical protein [Gluconacetobacter tumulisoli]|uniref:Uncharacterized protein n=1 Tax=Gluconacetobacter tumulisoli TaxID=1286189 RepID=A0A7W4K5H0_9PROT|nr:hypothetical protein [Gluconacetobacter tumulisoli]MBB2200731.1 hypothetical protein [Gluconacetobacter tumulisoli]
MHQIHAPRAPLVLLGLAVALLPAAARAASDAARCAGRPVTSFVGSVIGGYQLSQPWRFPNLLATGNIGLYQVDGTTRRLLDWPDGNRAWIRPPGYDGQAVMKAMIALWQGRAGGGMFEGGNSPALTPNVPPSHYHVSDDSQSGAQFRWFADGWHPQVAMLNLSYADTAPPFGGSYHNPSSEFTDRDVADTATALRDARMTTGAALVLPYISNGSRGHLSDSSDTDRHGNPGLGTRVQSDYATDPYYANSRRIALLAGGFGIDTPANIFSTDAYYGPGHSEMFRRLIASEIRWANRHHLTTAVFMTIFDTQHGMRGNGPDFRFLRGVQTEVRYLENADARPTYWIVGQYSNGPATTNMPETDTTPESITQVANWVARNAHTTPPPVPAATCSPPPAGPNG